jgi:hypothetical protein
MQLDVARDAHIWKIRAEILREKGAFVRGANPSRRREFPRKSRRRRDVALGRKHGGEREVKDLDVRRRPPAARKRRPLAVDISAQRCARLSSATDHVDEVSRITVYHTCRPALPQGGSTVYYAVPTLPRGR